ncbi:MAG TPA: TonB-dependent receptor [Rhodocyclaceae bacterium]|jgi:iron complex outermembrane receptor protein
MKSNHPSRHISVKAKHLRHKAGSLLLTQAIACLFSTAWAAENQDSVLKTIDVQGNPISPYATWQEPDKSTTSTTYQVGRDGMETFGAAGGANSYSLVSGLPSVKVQLLDPYGMANKIGGNKGLRVRGIAAWHGGNGTVDGLNLSGVNPGAGYLTLFDIENFSGASLAQGAVPPDKSNLFTVAGALDSQLWWPSGDAERILSASTGSFNFQRLFARVSSGAIGDSTHLALSASDTSSDLWRGPGTSKRGNYEAAITSQLGDLDLRFLVAKSDIDQHNYRGLSAAQAGDLNQYQKLGFDSTPTAGSYQNYYQYNRQSFINTAYIGEARYRLSQQSRVTVKAYYMDEDGWSLDATTTANQVRYWLMKHNSYGFNADLETVIANTAIKTGLNVASMEPPGPPNAQKTYTASATGLTPLNWTTLSKVTDRHQFQNIYAMGTQEHGDLKIQAGARYAREIMPSMAEYNKTGMGALSYDDAIKASTVAVNVKGPTVSEWLPFFGLTYALNPNAELRANIGRTYGAPSFDMWSQNAKSQTQAIAQALWNTLKPELDDAVDLGLRLTYANSYVEPVIYYAKIQNKSVTAPSPITGFATAFAQNVGNGYTQGAQVSWGWTPAAAWTLFGTASINKAVFDQNITGVSQSIIGQQFPDTPKVMANLGTSWSQNGYTVTPTIQYMGERYDNVTHDNRIAGFFTVNLDLNYRQKTNWGKADYSVTVLNLLDRRYINLIDASDLNSGATTFYPGAPRTLMAKMSVSF